MPSLRQELEKLNNVIGLQVCPNQDCHREHFCARCKRELKISRRVPVEEGFLCATCARKKPRAKEAA